MMENIMDSLGQLSHSLFVATGANTIAASLCRVKEQILQILPLKWHTALVHVMCQEEALDQQVHIVTALSLWCVQSTCLQWGPRGKIMKCHTYYYSFSPLGIFVEVLTLLVVTT
jgi:hypothetical protein